MMTSLDFQALTSSISNEWYTPPDIIAQARSVMGSIELDPASCLTAQHWIKADRYFTQADDGIQQPWIANTLWLNPPYGKRSQKAGIYGASAWLEKLHNEHQIGNVKQAIVLARGDSKGFQILTRHYPFIECKRISFLTNAEVSDSPVPGSRIFGLGVDLAKFAYAFKNLGILLKAVNLSEIKPCTN